jgi:hypothetical protein
MWAIWRRRSVAAVTADRRAPVSLPENHTEEETSHLDRYPEPEPRSADGPPRWLTVLGVVVAVLVVLMFVLLHLTGAVGPGVH